MAPNKPKKIAVIGGGTGTFVTLNGLKQYPVDLSAIITMTDSGGSSGKLRDQYGVLPPGDIRQALVALSDSDKIWRELFLYRFENGDFSGHNFGNLFLTVLEKITNSFEKSIELAEEILKTKGQIIPVTLEKTHIDALLTDGTTIKTEALIDKKVKRAPIAKLYLEQEVKTNPKALASLKEAEVIIIGPGDLYTSILPIFVFKDIVRALRNSKAKKVLVLNLMNKLGQTDNFRSSQFIKIYSEYLGANPFDYLIINKQSLPKPIIDFYKKSGETEVTNDLQSNANIKVLEGNLISKIYFEKSSSDILDRSVLRHDSAKLAQFLWQKIIQ